MKKPILTCVHVLLIGLAVVAISIASAVDEIAYLKSDRPTIVKEFGAHMTIDRDVAAIQSFRDDGESQSAVYLYERLGNDWKRTATLHPELSSGIDRSALDFGRSLAISGDTVVVGSPSESTGEVFNHGAVYVFQRTGGSWRRTAYITPSVPQAEQRFGASVAIDGDRLVIGQTGRHFPTDTEVELGRLYCYRLQEGNWTLTQEIESQYRYPSGANGFPTVSPVTNFGFVIELSGDTLAVGVDDHSAARGIGGKKSDTDAKSSGAVWVYRDREGSWQTEAFIKPSNTEAGAFFGGAVAVSGNRIVVGASGESSAGVGVNGNQSSSLGHSTGAAYIFSRRGTSWEQEAYLKAPEHGNTGGNGMSGDSFGSDVAIDGDTALVGARFDDNPARGVSSDPGAATGRTRSGAVHMFQFSSGAWSQTAFIKSSNADEDDWFGLWVDLSGDYAFVTAHREAGGNGNLSDNSAPGSGAVYIFRIGPTTAIWDSKDGFDFTHPENWSTGALPGPADTVQLSEPDQETMLFPAGELFDNELLVANSASKTDIDLNGSIWRIGNSVEANPIGQVRLTGASVAIVNGTLEVPQADVVLRNDGIANSYLSLARGGKLRAPQGAISVGREGDAKEATLDVEGENSLAEAFALNVGDTGRGNVLVTGGGNVVVTQNFYIGIDGAGSMTLSGTGSSVDVAEGGDVRIGFRKSGTLTLEGGTSAGFGEGVTVRIGGEEVEGQLNLLGTGTTLIGGSLGVERLGVLTLLDGAAMIVDAINLKGGGLTVRSGSGAAVNEEITLANRASAEIADGGVLNGSSLFIGESRMTIGAGGRVVVSGLLGTTLSGGVLDVGREGRLETPGLFIQSGRLLGRGTIVGKVSNFGGTIEPGESPGVLTIQGDYVQETGTLVLEVGGATAGNQHDQLMVTGDVSITGGGITLKFIDGFAPSVGQDFDFIQVAGGFDNAVEISVTGLKPGWQFDSKLDPATGKFTVSSMNQGIAAPSTTRALEFRLTAVSPATEDIPTSFSGAVNGPPNATVVLEASTDLGHADAWQEIGRITLDKNGSGAIASIPDPGSTGAESDFLRIRIVP